MSKSVLSLRWPEEARLEKEAQFDTFPVLKVPFKSKP